MIRVLALLALVGLSHTCNAAKPCEAVSSRVVEDVGYQERSKAVLAEFGRCLSTHDICSLTQTLDGSGGRLVAADTPAAVPPDGKERSSVAVAIQDGRQGACCVAVYSGGSAAAWLISGWTVEHGQPRLVPKLDRYGHTGERESTQALIREIGKARAWAGGTARR